MISVESATFSEYVTLEGSPSVFWRDTDDVYYSLDLYAGKKLVTHTDSHGRRYLGEQSTMLRSGWKNKPYKPYEVSVMYRVEPSGQVDLLLRNLDEEEIVVHKVSGVTATATRERRQSGEESRMRRELIYTGKAGKSLGVMYREFTNDMARPAFFQQLQYEPDTDPVIGYQAARLKILSATNTEVRYKVLAPLTLR